MDVEAYTFRIFCFGGGFVSSLGCGGGFGTVRFDEEENGCVKEK